MHSIALAAVKEAIDARLAALQIDTENKG